MDGVAENDGPSKTTISTEALANIDSPLLPGKRDPVNNPACYAADVDYVFADPQVGELRAEYHRSHSLYRQAKLAKAHNVIQLKEQATQLRNMYKMIVKRRKKQYKRVMEAARGPVANAFGKRADDMVFGKKLNMEKAFGDAMGLSGSGVANESHVTNLPTFAAFMASQGLDKSSLLIRSAPLRASEPSSDIGHKPHFLPPSSNSLVIDWVENSDDEERDKSVDVHRSLALIEKEMAELRRKLEGAEKDVSGSLNSSFASADRLDGARLRRRLTQSLSPLSINGLDCSSESSRHSESESKGVCEIPTSDIEGISVLSTMSDSANVYNASEKEEGELSDSEVWHDTRQELEKAHKRRDDLCGFSRETLLDQIKVKSEIKRCSNAVLKLDEDITQLKLKQQVLDAQLSSLQSQMETNRAIVRQATERDAELSFALQSSSRELELVNAFIREKSKELKKISGASRQKLETRGTASASQENLEIGAEIKSSESETSSSSSDFEAIDTALALESAAAEGREPSPRSTLSSSSEDNWDAQSNVPSSTSDKLANQLDSQDFSRPLAQTSVDGFEGAEQNNQRAQLDGSTSKPPQRLPTSEALTEDQPDSMDVNDASDAPQRHDESGRVFEVHVLLQLGDYWCMSNLESPLSMVEKVRGTDALWSGHWPEWTDLELFRAVRDVMTSSRSERVPLECILDSVRDADPLPMNATERFMKRLEGYVFLPKTELQRKLSETRTDDEFMRDLQSYCFNVDVSKALCHFELSGGLCKDCSCDRQHFKQMKLGFDDMCLHMLEWVPQDDRALVQLRLQRMMLEKTPKSEILVYLISFVQKGQLKASQSLAQLETELVLREALPLAVEEESVPTVVPAKLALKRAIKSVREPLHWRARAIEAMQELESGGFVPCLSACLLETENFSSFDNRAPVSPVEWLAFALSKLPKDFELPTGVGQKLDPRADACLSILRDGVARHKGSVELWHVYIELCLRRSSTIDEQINLLNEATVHLQAFVPLLWYKLVQFNCQSSPAVLLKALQAMNVAVTKFKASSVSLGMFNSIWAVHHALGAVKEQLVVAIQYVHSLLVAPDEFSIDRVLIFEHENILLSALDSERWDDLAQKPLFRLLRAREFLLLVYALIHAALSGQLLKVQTCNDCFPMFFVDQPPVYVLELRCELSNVPHRLLESAKRLIVQTFTSFAQSDCDGHTLLGCLISTIYLFQRSRGENDISELAPLLETFSTLSQVKDCPELFLYALHVARLNEIQPGSLNDCLQSYLGSKSCWAIVLREHLSYNRLSEATELLDQYLVRFLPDQRILTANSEDDVIAIGESTTELSSVDVLVLLCRSALDSPQCLLKSIKWLCSLPSVNDQPFLLLRYLVFEQLARDFSISDASGQLLALLLKQWATGSNPLVKRVEDSGTALCWLWGEKLVSRDPALQPSMCVVSTSFEPLTEDLTSLLFFVC